MKRIINYLPCIILTFLFVIWTILVKTVDVHFIKDVGYLGFYNFNSQVKESAVSFARADLFHTLTNVGLYIMIALAAVFAFMGVYQWVKRKSFKKIDPELFVLAATYLVSIAYYIVFEITKINYSPLSEYGNLKASYPSTHVLMFIVILVTGLMTIFRYLNASKYVKIFSYTVAGVLCLIYAFARLYSLHHYFSDIIASLLLASSIIALYVSLAKDFLPKKKEVVVDEEE